MAKGDDALARKRNRVRRKRLRSSENAVSARVAAIIASKKRRKSGKRRGCEGMCFSLPTPDDPFNERHRKKLKGDDEPTDDTPAAAMDGDDPKKGGANTKKQQQPVAKAGAKAKAVRERAAGAEEGRVDFDRPSKFLVVCLNAIRDAVAPEDGGGSIHGAGDWGVELWRCCSAQAPSDVLDASGACATVDQTAWLVSSACDIVARKERLGMVVSCPFLLYLVPSQEKAAQVRSICKPLKPLGIHSVSLHPGASIEHQISGLKTCEPEFLIATPERLLELVSLKAIDISSVSMLVIDGLKCFVDHNVSDKIFSIRDAISNNPQITIFTDPSDKKVATMAKSLLRGRITKLSINDSVSSRSAFIAQHVHFCPSEELKTLKPSRWRMPPRGRRCSGSRMGGGRSGSGSGPSDSKPAALRRIMRERQSSVKGISGSKSKASEGATQSVPPSVSSSSSSSSSSSLPSDSGSDTETSYEIFVNNGFRIKSDYGDSGDNDDNDSQFPAFELDEAGKEIASIANSLPYDGLMLLLFETPSGFALFTFDGVNCYLERAVDNLWTKFGDPRRASMMVFPKGFLSFEDKSRAINADTGVDSQLADLINEWHHPGMNLCVEKLEYKRIIESVLKIPCMCCHPVLEIMWGIQQQMRTLVPLEKSKLTKEDRLPTSQGLMKFLSNCGFDVKPEMVNEKIFLTACALFHCDADDKKNLGLLRDAGLHIRDISGIACKDWDILKLAVAVKVICCPKEELSDFHEVLAEDVVSKLKSDARKYKGVAVKVCWLNTYDAVVCNHRLRIAKKKMLGSLVEKAKKAYEAKQTEVCENVKLHGESQQIAQDHVSSVSNPTRRSSRLNRKLNENSGQGILPISDLNTDAPCVSPMAMDD